MNDKDYIVIWLLGLIFIALLVWLSLPFVVNTAYRGSDYVLEAIR